MRALKILCGVAVLATFLAPARSHRRMEQANVPDLQRPGSDAGATLPAGTYTFELADPDSTRHLIRVREKDTNKLVTCYPFEYVGHAPRCFIVKADLVEEERREK
jgi:hypothetical protein